MFGLVESGTSVNNCRSPADLPTRRTLQKCPKIASRKKVSKLSRERGRVFSVLAREKETGGRARARRRDSPRSVTKSRAWHGRKIEGMATRDGVDPKGDTPSSSTMKRPPKRDDEERYILTPYGNDGAGQEATVSVSAHGAGGTTGRDLAAQDRFGPDEEARGTGRGFQVQSQAP